MLLQESNLTPRQPCRVSRHIIHLILQTPPPSEWRTSRPYGDPKFGVPYGTWTWFVSTRSFSLLYAPPFYLSDSTQMIISGDSKTQWVLVTLGVHQGSVLGQPLFILFAADIPSLFPNHLSTGHPFGDDVQACVHGPCSVQLLLTCQNDALSQDLHIWMSSNRFNLNSSKTQLIWFGTPQQLQKLDYFPKISSFT